MRAEALVREASTFSVRPVLAVQAATVAGMPSPREGWETRLSIVERDIHVAAEEARVARLLASTASSDAADVKATLARHTQVINAWGDQLNTRIDRLEARVDNGFMEMRSKFDTLTAGQEAILHALDRIAEPDGPSST